MIEEEGEDPKMISFEDDEKGSPVPGREDPVEVVLDEIALQGLEGARMEEVKERVREWTDKELIWEIIREVRETQ